MAQDFQTVATSTPFITADEMREVDRLMIDEYGIALLQMMENAGRNMAQLAGHRFFSGSVSKRGILVLVGPGGNGGGGLAAARHLHNAGAQVEVLLAAPEESFSPAAEAQLKTIHRIAIPVTVFDGRALPRSDLIIDAIFGYGASGRPREPAASLIRIANNGTASILANDLPSGVNATTGSPAIPAVRASATLTIALPKAGLSAREARPFVGELYLGDISVPPELYLRSFPELEATPDFGKGPILRVW